MLQLAFDRSTRAVVPTTGSIKSSAREAIKLSLLDNGVAATLSDAEAIVLQLKPKGQTDGDCVLLEKVLETAQYVTLSKRYEAELNAFTSPILTLLGLNDENGANDAKAPVVVDGYLLLFTEGDNEPIESNTFDVTLVPAKYLNSDTTPLALPGPLDWLVAHATRYLPAVTGLTGGGATNLDGFPTVGLSVPVLLETVINDVSSKWLLKAGTDAVDGVGSIRPTDYNASTNAKYWFQIA